MLWLDTCLLCQRDSILCCSPFHILHLLFCIIILNVSLCFKMVWIDRPSNLSWPWMVHSPYYNNSKCFYCPCEMLCLDFRVIQETVFSQRWQAISVCKSCQVQAEHVLQPQTNGWSSFFQVNMFLFNESAVSKVSFYCRGTKMFSGLISNLGRFCFQSVILNSLLEKHREKETACVSFHSTVNSANTGRNCCLLSNLWTQAGEMWS